MAARKKHLVKDPISGKTFKISGFTPFALENLGEADKPVNSLCERLKSAVDKIEAEVKRLETL